MSLPATLGEALAVAHGRIPAAEAKLLLREASGASAAQIVAYPEAALTADAAARYADWVVRRAAGEPVAYLVGWREFFGRRFAVSPATLIPRPETELLVERALIVIAGVPAPRVADLGTGSGCIGLSIALEYSAARVSLVDQSAAALAIATQNAQALGAGVETLQGDWLLPLAGQRFDCIVSNPPYVADGDAHLTQGDLRFEPRSALAAGSDGLQDIRRIVTAAPAYLQAQGWLLLEHGFDQAEPVRELLRAAGFTSVSSWCDLAGIERVSGGRLEN